MGSRSSRLQAQAKRSDTLTRHPRFEGWILGSVGFEGQNQFSQLCSSIFRHRVSSCCSISLFMYFNSNFSTGGTAHGSLESICLDPGVGQKRQAH